jgi:hypothetical protein
VNTPISAHLVGWSAKALDMVLEAMQPLLIIIGVTFQHLPASDDASLDFIQPDFVTIFRGFPGFVPADDVRMRLEQADNLLTGRHFFTLKHTPHALRDHLLGSRDKGFQEGSQSVGFLVGHYLQGRQNLLSLHNRLPVALTSLR